MDLSRLNKKALIDQLYSELIYYDEGLYKLCKILVDELPRKMVFRIISKMYRLRSQ